MEWKCHRNSKKDYFGENWPNSESSFEKKKKERKS